MGCVSSRPVSHGVAPSGSSSVSSRPFSDDEVLQVFNWLPAKVLHQKVGSLVSSEKAEQLVKERMKRGGGIFWTLEELQAELKGVGIEYDEIKEVALQSIGSDRSLLPFLSPHITTSNSVECICDGPECRKAIIGMIQQAQVYIDLSVMLFFNDVEGQLVVNELVKKAKEGVEVRVIVDRAITLLSVDSPRLVKEPERAMFSKLEKILKDGGVSVVSSSEESYLDIYWNLKKREDLKSQGVPEVFLQLQDMVQKDVQLNANVVYHRKFMVVDGVKAWVGSLNVGDEYTYDSMMEIEGNPFGISTDRDQWHDGLMTIDSSDTAQFLHTIFCSQWLVLGGDIFQWDSPKYHPKNLLPSNGNMEVAIMISFPGNPFNRIQQYFVDLINHGKGVMIENPYIIDDDIWKNLKELTPEQAKEITICNPLTVNDHETQSISVRTHMHTPAKLGVSFYDYGKTERFSHWKICCEESTSTVNHGSYNLNTRSELHDFELNVLVRSEKIFKDVQHRIQGDIAVSNKTPLADFKPAALDAITLALKEYFS